MNSAIGNPQGLMVGRLLILEEQRHAILRRSALKSEFRTLHIHLVTRFNFRPYYQLRILAIDDPKISQKLAFLGYWHECIHGTPIHLILKFGAGSYIQSLKCSFQS